MVVQVDQKRMHRRPRPGARISLLGDRLPERIRSTAFALLGTTAALGLAVVAIALQGDWPLVAGSPVPPAPPRHQAIGGAEALGPRAGATHPASPSHTGKVASHRHNRPASPHTESTPAAAPAPPGELVSSPAAPVSPPSGAAQHGGHSHPSPAPQSQQPSSAPQPQKQPSAPAEASPEGEAPTTAPTTPAEAPQPEATSSGATPPAESNVPEWSNGKGHAWGRADDKDHGPGCD
jgi:hypothetical protein